MPSSSLLLQTTERTRQDSSGSVASLLADGGFLKWDFNVFTLEERSQGHSLWCVDFFFFAIFVSHGKTINSEH